LSHLEAADSESVDELIEGGNAFAADVVAGVESAGNADEKEVRRTRCRRMTCLGSIWTKSRQIQLLDIPR
jgi:hypothetical protein